MMEDSSILVQLRQQLLEELGKTEPDSNVILDLSNKIAKHDSTQVRFSVDAGIINRLGKELVGRHETAVSELVKNAYDADALEVNIIFEEAWSPGGTLIIEDNGVGMTRQQLIDGFMRLSSADKLHNPISPRYNRVRAGKKGIGRFATQRLGTELTIISQTIEQSQATKVTINWELFEPNKDLFGITNAIEIVPKEKAEGTKLIITGLREGWSDAMIRRVYRYTLDLIQPFPLSKERKAENENRIDPGFKSFYFRKIEDRLEAIVDEEQAIFNNALAEIEGYVKDDGQAYWSLESKTLNIAKEEFPIGQNREDPKSNFKFIHGVHFKAYYFIYSQSLIPSQQVTFIRELAREKGGIRLYRNGFRVLPYGEAGNDWLRLDESARRNIFITPHANNNFFGFVEITDKTGITYEETSSREGLIENEAFDELTDFVYRALVSATVRVADVRGTKSTASQKDWKKTESPSQQIDNAISDLNEILENDENADSHGALDEADKNNPNIGSSEPLANKNAQLKDALKRLSEGREKEKELNEQLLADINMFRVLAGLGIVIGEFIHEVKRFLPAFDTDTTYLKEVLKNNAVAYERALRLSNNLKSFTTYTSYFDRTISQNVIRQLEEIEVRDVVDEFRSIVQADTERSGIEFLEPTFNDFDLFTIKMHKSEWASILFNLYTNSKKAIKRSENAPGKVFISAGRNGDNILMEFSDNGDGIPVENRSRIFDAFFTTTSAASANSSESEASSGTGLGLKIVNDIIESYGGAIVVAEPLQGFSTTIRIIIPAKEKNND